MPTAQYTVLVDEIRQLRREYTVEGDSEDEARDRAAAGETLNETDVSRYSVMERNVIPGTLHQRQVQLYEIEQYELHTMKYRVEAASLAEAIALRLEGAGDAVADSLALIEVAEDFGLPADDDRDLCDALHKLGLSVKGSVIPSIREIHEVQHEPSVPDELRHNHGANLQRREDI